MADPQDTELPDETETVLDEGLAEISAELFGEADEAAIDADPSDGEVVEEGQEGVAVSPSGDPLLPPEGEKTPVAEDAPKAPETWTAEAAAQFTTLPPVVQAEILKREQDIFKGIEGYKQDAATGKAYASVAQPYMAELASQNLDPVDLFRAFAGNHYILAKGTPEQKVEKAAELLRSYNIDPAQVSARLGPQPYVDPEVQQLRQELEQIRSGFTSQQQSAAKAQQAQVLAQVEAFAADPANIYFQECANDITALLKSGVAQTLSEAYEKAIYLNPVTRAKEVSRLQTAAAQKREAEASEKLAKAKAAQALNVKSKANGRDSTVPIGTMDDTLAETYARITSA